MTLISRLHPWSWRASALGVVLVLSLSACSDDSGTTTTGDTTAASSSTTAATTTTTTSVTTAATSTTTTSTTSTTIAPTTTTSTTTTTISPGEPSGNRAPTVTIATPGNLTVFQNAVYDPATGMFGSAITFTAVASDPDGDPITIKWFSSQEGLLGSGASLTATIHTIGSDSSQPIITVRATDKWGRVSEYQIQIAVSIPSST